MYLYGASGHCKVIIDIIKHSTTKIITAVFDDSPKESTILDVPVLDATTLQNTTIDELLISIGDNRLRKNVVEKTQANYISIVHTNAIVSNYAHIDCGTVVMPGAIINASASIGKHCIINSGAVVEHDCKLADFVHISPNASIAGNVTIGEGTHIGIGAVIIQGVTIGKWVVVGAGAVIIKDIPSHVLVVGNPARVVKERALI